MDNKTIENIINNYEGKLKKRDENFKLTDFERILMRECLQHGYEMCLNKYTIKE